MMYLFYYIAIFDLIVMIWYVAISVLFGLIEQPNLIYINVIFDSRFKVFLFVTYSIIQDIISSEM